MMSRTGKYTKTLFVLAAVLLAMTSHAQEPPADICAGTDAVEGTVHGIVEAGARVFTLTSNSGDHPRGGGVYISCDGGDAWYKHPAVDEGGSTIAVDPDDTNTIYAGIGGGFVFVSQDAGETWTSRRPVEIGNISVTALVALPGGQVFAGMGLGELLQSSDYGSSWQSLSMSLPPEMIHVILVDSANSNRILVAVGDAGVYQSLDGGQSFERSSMAGSIVTPVFLDARDIVLTPSNTSQVIAGGPNGLVQSVDGGQLFSSLAGATDVVDITYGRRDMDTMFVVSEFAGVLRSTDGGQSFSLHAPDLPQSRMWFRRVQQLENGRLLLGSVADGVFKSDDAGVTWQSTGAPPPPPPPPPPPAEVTANLNVSVENLTGGAAIEAGTEARFRIVVRNDGPDVSTNTFARFSWSLPGTGGGSSKAFSLTSSAGSCVVARDVESGCTIASLGVGQSVTIEFSGTTSTSFIGSHTISVGATNDEGANVSANGTVSTKKSILCIGDCDGSSSGGGGAGGIPMLAVLLLIALRRRRQIG